MDYREVAMSAEKQKEFPIIWNSRLKFFPDERITGKLMIDDKEVEIDVDEKNKSVQQVFQRMGTSIDWRGKTGRPYDFLSWIHIKDAEKECYVTHARSKKGSFRWERISRQDTSKLFNTFKTLGYDTLLNMSTFAVRKAIVYFMSLIILGGALYIFAAEEVTSKNGVLSGTQQILLGCLFLILSIVLACAGYFGVRNQPPIPDEE
jgi:hypothetical protein